MVVFPLGPSHRLGTMSSCPATSSQRLDTGPVLSLLVGADPVVVPDVSSPGDGPVPSADEDDDGEADDADEDDDGPAVPPSLAAVSEPEAGPKESAPVGRGSRWAPQATVRQEAASTTRDGQH